MTLRDQILALPTIRNLVETRRGGPLLVRRDAVLALLSEGPTPTQIEAGGAALLEAAGSPPTSFVDYLPGEGQRIYSEHLAEAVLRAASEATP